MGIQDLNIHDTFQQRVEKFNRSPARKMLSASVEVKNGAQLKKYEMINMWSQQRSASLKKKCLCSEVQLPILPRELPAVQMIRSAIPAVLTSQIYNGQCEPSAHAMTFKVEAKMTPERKELVSSSAAWPVYDMVNVELHKMRIEAPATLEKAIDFSHRFFYPSFKAAPPQSSPSRIAAILATRSPRTDLVKVQLQTPRQLSSLTDIKVPKIIDTIARVMSQ